MPDQVAEQPQIDPEAVDRRSILIVEDDSSIADVLSHRLTRQGFETLVARCGHEGLLLAQTQHPDLVLLDIHLPDIDGFSICQQLVDSPHTCDIPVIILSGMERPDIIRRSRAAGCQYFVRKPYDPNALLILIDQAIGESGTDEGYEGWASC